MANDFGTHIKNGVIYSGGSQGGGKVNSVNGLDGDVVLTGEDVILNADGTKNIAEAFGGLTFGIDGDGNCGYYKADGSFVPFKSGGGIDDLLNTKMLSGNYDYATNDYADMSISVGVGTYLIIFDIVYSRTVSQDNTVRIDNGDTLFQKFSNSTTNSTTSQAYKFTVYLAKITSTTRIIVDSYSKVITARLYALKLA